MITTVGEPPATPPTHEPPGTGDEPQPRGSDPPDPPGPPDPPDPPQSTEPTDLQLQPPSDSSRTERLSPRTRLGCAPLGCELWRSEELEHRPALAWRDLLVHIGRRELIGVDTITGRVLWQRDRPVLAPGASPPLVSAHLLDDAGLAVAYGGRLDLHSGADGTLRASIDLEPVAITDLARRDGSLYAFGRIAGVGDRRDVVVALTDDGEIRWRRTVDRLLRSRSDTPEDAALIADVDGSLVRLRPTDGAAAWRFDIGEARVIHDRHLLLVDRVSEIAEIVHTVTGARQTLPHVTGTQRAHRLGPWVALETPEALHVIDPEGGRELFVRPEHPRPPSALQVGDRMVLAWPPPVDGTTIDLEIGIHRLDGTLEATVAVPAPSSNRIQRGWPRLTEEDSLVRVTVGDGRDIALIDPHEHRIVELRHLDADARDQVVSLDGLTTVRRGERLTIHGPSGAMIVRGASRIVSSDPLIVQGEGGTLGLERGLLGL